MVQHSFAPKQVHKALDFGMALTTRKGMNMVTASSGNKGKALQICICGWSEGTSLKGLSIQEGRKKCLDDGVQGTALSATCKEVD